jgi:integrase
VENAYDPEAILEEAEYFRKGSRDIIKSQATVKRMALSVVGRRRRGSPATANGYVQGVKTLCDFLGLHPDEVIQQTKAGRLDLAKKINSEGDGFIDTVLNRGIANKTVWGWLAGIKRWTEVNEAPVNWENIERPTAAVTKNKDKAPTPQQLKLILSYADLKERAAIAVMSTSGLRVGTLLSLRWREIDFSRPDVAKLKIERELGRKFGAYKEQLNGEPESFTTFASTTARAALLSYRRSLEENGEPIGAEYYIFPADRHPDKKMSISAWQYRWYRLLRRTKLTEKSVDQYLLRTHGLRKFFRSRAVGLDSSIREYFMGHRGGYLDQSYLRMSEAELYSAYAAIMPRLEVEVSEAEEETQELKKQIQALKTQLEKEKSHNEYNDERFDKLDKKVEKLLMGQS